MLTIKLNSLNKYSIHLYIVSATKKKLTKNGEKKGKLESSSSEGALCYAP